MRSKDAQGFAQNKTAVQMGGTIAGNAQKQLELVSSEEVLSSENYLDESESKKRKRFHGPQK